MISRLTRKRLHINFQFADDTKNETQTVNRGENGAPLSLYPLYTYKFLY